jgi:DNA-binding MarR family transcriptional regulator
VSDIPPDIRQLIGRIGTFDHIEVLMRLYEAADAMTQAELVASTRLDAATVAKATTDLVAAKLVVRDPASGASRFDATPADRQAVQEVAELYHKRPVTLVKLVYAQPSSPVQSFADAFRIVDKHRDD